MTEEIEIVPAGNVLELHYWLKNNSHTMDALVENKCEYELLTLIKEIANIYSVKIQIETEPTAEGGIRRWFTVISSEENRKGTITTAIIVMIITTLLFTPLTQISGKLIDKLFEDTELNDLQKEKLRLEIQELKDRAAAKNNNVDNNNAIKKRTSNFYEALDGYSKIEKISFVRTNEKKEKVSKEITVSKNEFKSHILVSDDLDPIEIESAIIEIISPVLKKGNYKWLGYYSGQPIIFNMQSNEFKTLVQNAEIEFKNGSSIDCFLRIRRKIDNEGLEYVVGYDVVLVNHYFENETPIETKEGKKHRQIKEAERNQINLFDEFGPTQEE